MIAYAWLPWLAEPKGSLGLGQIISIETYVGSAASMHEKESREFKPCDALAVVRRQLPALCTHKSKYTHVMHILKVKG